jgi:hypothetical protein
MLIMNNVPCQECEYCGEQYFEAAVLRKIEAEYEAVASGRTRNVRCIEVPVEDYVQA